MQRASHSPESLLGALPPPWPESLLASNRAARAKRGERLVVLDDDPTGTQTVRDVPVLTRWSEDALARELAESPVFFVLTNSRSLAAPAAAALAREIGGALRAAAARVGCALAVVSRSDSTLRGHFPGEVDALAEALGGGFDAVLLVPYFGEGGRYTVDDVHYAEQGGRLVPVGYSEFARDPAFGYRSSNLREWVEERTGGRIGRQAVASIPIGELRRGGPDVVAARLRALRARAAVAVANAADDRDLEVLAAACLRVEAEGMHLLYRTAASFVRARAALERPPLLAPHALASGGPGGGLAVVGSHVPRTSEQLARALRLPGVEHVELAVPALIGPVSRERELARARAELERHLAESRDCVLFTSRELVAGESPEASLALGQSVSGALCELVAGLARAPRWLLAKGGITASDLATRGLGARRALVLGPLLPGVPVWELGPESRFPGLPYVVFPGNVGGPDGLSEAISALRGAWGGGN
jgi:uncharacterized protein YgbK (DUF1537 family)